MQTRAGGVYRVELELANAESIGPTWLVGAVTATYPQAVVLSVESYSHDSAVVIVKWHRGVGKITEGDSISVVPEGAQLPGYATPSAAVVGIAEVAPPSVSQVEIPNSVKLAIAGAMLLTVTYLSNKIAVKHG